MPKPSSQYSRQQGGKLSNSAGWFFDQYVADGTFEELDISMDDCATELLDSMEADRFSGSFEQNQDLDLEALPFMNWGPPSVGMEGMWDSQWSTSQNSALAGSPAADFGGSNEELLNLDGSFQGSQCSDAITDSDQMMSNGFDLSPTTLTQCSPLPSAEASTQQERCQDPDMDSFAVLNAAFRDLVHAKAAADSRCLSQKTKQRDASIALHLERLRAACDQTAQLLESTTEGHGSMDSAFGSAQISSRGDHTETFQTQLQKGTATPSNTMTTHASLAMSPTLNYNLENPTMGCLSSSGCSSTQSSSPGSNCSGPSQRSLPEISSSSENFSPSTSQLPSTAQTPAGSQGIHDNGSLEIVLDLNMNPSTSLPRKQRKRSQAQRERYQNVRKHGACSKHKKLKKLCTCFDNAAPQAATVQKIEANSSKLAKARGDTSSLRTCQPVKSTHVNSKGTFVPVPSDLPSSSTTSGHDRLLSRRLPSASTAPGHDRLQSGGLPFVRTIPGHDRLLSEKYVLNTGDLTYLSTPEPTPGSFLCLIPGCTYSGVDVLALESHYRSMHARELSLQTSVSRSVTAPVMSPVLQQRTGLDKVRSVAQMPRELALGTVPMDPTDLLSQQDSVLRVQGSGKIDPDIDCRIVGSCDTLKKAGQASLLPARLRLPDVTRGLLSEVFGLLGLFSVFTVWLVGLLWNLFVKIFARDPSNCHSILHQRKHALFPRHFRNTVISVLT